MSVIYCMCTVCLYSLDTNTEGTINRDRHSEGRRLLILLIVPHLSLALDTDCKALICTDLYRAMLSLSRMVTLSFKGYWEKSLSGSANKYHCFLIFQIFFTNLHKWRTASCALGATYEIFR